MLTAQTIIDKLNLKPHPEGGYFSETYRSVENLPESSLPFRYKGQRSIGTCIYYLLTPDTFSAMHRLKSDEIFHFYMGDPVEMTLLFPGGTTQTILLGHDILNGALPQVVVPANVWQGSRLRDGGKYALLGTTVAPGFEFDDIETGDRTELYRLYPDQKDKIKLLTKGG